MRKPILVRITTVPVSLKILLKGQMRYMEENGFKVIMISAAGKEIESLVKHEGCVHKIFPFTRNINVFKDLLCLLSLTFYFIKIKPAIVHTHTPKAGLIGMLAAFFSGVPIRLHTVAGLKWIGCKGRIRHVLILLEKLTAYASTCVYPNSANLKMILCSIGVKEGKMKIIGNGTSNGIDTEYFSKTKEIIKQSNKLKIAEKVDSDAWIWIYIGRIVKDKGINELLTSFKEISKSYPKDKLWLLGEMENEYDPLQETDIEIIKNCPSIRHWGFIDDIRPYLAASKVLVFPSYREGFPNVPLQAAAMNVMLILSNINGCNEIVVDSVNGYLVEPKNSIELIRKMIFVRENPNIQEQFSEAIRKEIESKYDQSKIWKQILEEYHYWLNK